MSRSSPLTNPMIKLEHESDDEFIVETNQTTYSHRPSTEMHLVSASQYPSAYKGKIEVTSKGRRKIFDGVRWQILCRRADCRKQTNKKSLCITHYKEEYEKQSIQTLARLSFYSNPTISSRHSSTTNSEDQNNTISTTNSIDRNDRLPIDSSDGQIKWMRNGRRCVFKNQKWQILCKYDNHCRNVAQYEFYCSKHFQTMKRRLSTESNRTIVTKKFCSGSSIEPIISSSSSVIDQFDINSDENEIVRFPPSPSQISTNPNNNLSNVQPIRSTRCDQSIQTDITIPDCCFLHYGHHSLFSSCFNGKSTSSKQHLQFYSMNRSSR